MGYRLTVEQINKEDPYFAREDIFYGTKLYGYIDFRQLPNLESFKFLEKTCNITEDEFYGSYSDPFLICIRDFREFAELYKKDYIDYWNERYAKNKENFTGEEMWKANGWDENPKIQNILKNPEINELDFVVLSWG